jgi:hypothetical protein
MVAAKQNRRYQQLPQFGAMGGFRVLAFLAETCEYVEALPRSRAGGQINAQPTRSYCSSGSHKAPLDVRILRLIRTERAIAQQRASISD